MTRRLWLLLLVAASLAVPLGSVRAQRGPHVEIQLPATAQLASEGPVVRARRVLSDARMRELLRSGFPARLTYRVELWSDERFFDQLQQSAEWEVQVRWRGIDQRYEVVQRVGTQIFSLGTFAELEDAESAMERPLRVPIVAPASNRRFYYQVSLEVRTLSVSDLDEVNAWLRGELQPAVRGERNPGTALTRGIRSLSTRLLGGERREYVGRTATFRPGR